MAKIVVANWKMNPQSKKEAEILFNDIVKLSKNIKNIQIIICPPFPYLFIYKKIKSKKIFLGAQNVVNSVESSHTGEIPPSILSDMGVKYVIVGHSERRLLGENNKIINEKILNSLKFKISPILCIGEKNRDKEGFYLSSIGEQIKECLAGVSRLQMKNIIIAYEPVWAIGKNAIREATTEEFMEIKIFIKKILSDIYGSKIAHSTTIIYGGSVNGENVSSFMKDDGADGVLVGRDSLNPKKFNAILNALN